MSTQDEKSQEPFSWSTENEINLFKAMIGHKPAGVNKHFNMLFICEKMNSNSQREINSDCIWKYLETLYNLDMIDDIERIPLTTDERDFELPDVDYGILMKNKLKEIFAKVEEVEDRSASPRNVTTPRPRGSAVKENLNKSTSKKEHNEKKSQAKDIITGTPAESLPIKNIEKEAAKTDPRRDSKDSTSSTKESTKANNTTKTTTKESKSTKPNRFSLPDKIEDPSKNNDDTALSKRGNKRSTRGSLKNEELTLPSRRRRI